jgi:hypothetical protein
MNMFHLCIFVPILHSETPKPTNVSKKPLVWKGRDDIFPEKLFEETSKNEEIKWNSNGN